MNHIANENKAKNEATYKKWLSQHAPAEIRAANNARNQLKALAKKDGKTKAYRHIQDERLVKQARTAYIFFTQDRFASGDMRNMRIAEVGPLIAREWKALSPAEKKVCHTHSCPGTLKDTLTRGSSHMRIELQGTRLGTSKSIPQYMGRLHQLRGRRRPREVAN